MTDMPAGDECDDGDPCNVNDVCDGAGNCSGTDTGLTDCGGVCVDLMTDHEHCGGCGLPCLFDEDCVAGGCVINEWTPVGGGLSPGGENILAQAVATEGTDPFVAIVRDPGGDRAVSVLRYQAGAWNNLGSLECATDNSTASVDLEFGGGRPYLIFPHHRADSNTRIKHCESDILGCRDEFYQTFCLSNSSVNMALWGQDAHFSTIGAGGCGIGVGYGWYELASDTFIEHTDARAMGFGLLHWEGNGKPGVGVADKPYVGVMGRDWLTSSNIIYVVYWDDTASQWVPLDGDLKEHNGECGFGGPSGPCAIRLTSDSSGVLYAAWTEKRDPNTRLVYVKRHDPPNWTLLGGAVNDFSSAGNPAIHFAGSELFVAYQDIAAANTQVFVKRWNGSSWDRVGPPLNNDPVKEAVEPDIMSIGAAVYVSFREDTGGGIYDVFVKSFP